MKSYATTICLLPILAISSGDAKAGTAETSVAKSAPTATVASANTPTPRPQSVFVIPANSKEGRNPFFPRSKTEAPVVAPKAETIESVSFVLNGITSPPKRTAMINGRTFEAGEEGDVRFQNGKKVSIQCLEIRDDSVIIKVGNQQRELHIRGGL